MTFRQLTDKVDRQTNKHTERQTDRKKRQTDIKTDWVGILSLIKLTESVASMLQRAQIHHVSTLQIRQTDRKTDVHRQTDTDRQTDIKTSLSLQNLQSQ